MNSSIRGLMILGLLIFASCASQPLQLPSVQPIKQTVSVAQGQIKKAQQSTTIAQQSATAATTKLVKLEQLATNQKDTLTLTLAQGAHADVDKLSQELVKTQTVLANSEDQLGTAQEQLNTTQKDLKKAQGVINKAAATAKKYHKLKWGLVIPLAMGLVGLILFHFSGLLLAIPYVGWGVMVGLPTIVFLILAFKL